MDTSKKVILGAGLGILAAGAFLMLRKKEGNGPVDPAVHVSPEDVIDPSLRALTAEQAERLDGYLAGYALDKVSNPRLNTFLYSASRLIQNTTTEDPNALVPNAVRFLIANEYDVLITHAVAQAALETKPANLPAAISLVATRDPAVVQDEMHKGAYVYRFGRKIENPATLPNK